MTLAAPSTPQPPSRDGRRRRGQDNRARIVAAMLDIIRSGEVAPNAEQVASRADVGLRTVFRHFQDMDSLYGEMGVVIEAELQEIVRQPFQSAAWQDRIVELIDRRAVGFEKIAPFKRAADAFRHRSSFLQANGQRFSAILREILLRELPPSVANATLVLEVLDLLLSFEAWSRLRREQGLAPDRASAILKAAVLKQLR